MKILYGVCGEGFGHSSRAKVIINHLQKKDHKILIITYGKAYPILKNFNTIKVEGITLSFKKERLSLPDTISHNIKTLPKNIKNFEKIKKKINNFSPQLCISDMEPFIPIISNILKLPLISIDNQHRLTHMKIKVPSKYKEDFLVAKTAVNMCVSRAEAFIILSFVKGKKTGKDIYIVNPILRKEIIKLKPKKTNKILVYQTRPNKKLIKILKNISEKFVVYGYNKEKIEQNLEFLKTGKNFIKNLAKCKAVIATSGFTLMSESIYLKKPYFAIPQKGQFEQTLNSLFLKNSKLGDFSEDPTEKEINIFLKNLKKYESNLKKQKTNPSEALTTLDKILKSIKLKRFILNKLFDK